MKTVHSPISNDPYSDDSNDDLCYNFRSEHNVIEFEIPAVYRN